MAERPTKKERRELAKAANASAARRARQRAIRARITRVAVALLAVAGVVFYFMNQSKVNEERRLKVASLATELGCTGSVKSATDADLTEFPLIGQEHINTDETYPRMPPESGNHRPAPSKTGIHTRQIETETQIHNLEHGHIALNYHPDVPSEVVTALNGVASSNPGWILSAPYEEFTDETQVSILAWRYRLDCADVTAEDAPKVGELAKAFADTRRDKATESIAGTPMDPEDDSDSSSGDNMDSGS